MYRHLGSKCLTEEVETHVVIRLLFRLLHLGGRGEGRGVGQVGLQLLGSLEGDFGDGCEAHQVLEAVDHRVRGGGHGGVADLQAHSSHVGDTLHEGSLEVIVSDVEDLGVEDGAVVVDVLDHQAVRGGGDVQHVQEGGLGHADLVANGDQGHVGDNLDGTPGDLGGDGQGLEERGLLGAEAGVLGRDGDVYGGNGAGPGGSLDLVFEQQVADLVEVLGGEDESDVADDAGQDLLQLWVLVQHAADG